ncbi:hypothetical protein MMC21_003351 [Puttea exsequens]|nr:hypothetical protein [Puttea exsequens]
MPSQTDMNATRPCDFFENVVSGGQLKTKNVPSTHAQREVATNRGKRSPFKADVRLVTCVHGKMSEQEPIPASLIVLEYHIGCIGQRHRYNSLTTRLAFRSEGPKDLKDEPFVKAYAPFRKSERFDEVEIEYAKKRGIEANAGVSFSPASAGLGFITELERKYNMKSCASGQAFQEFTDGKSGSDAILWELRENKIKGVGIPDTFRVALLIQRTNLKRFTADFSLDLHAGLWFAATETFKNFCGIAETDEPIIFDPSIERQGELANIEPTRLGSFMDPGKIQELCPVHLM